MKEEIKEEIFSLTEESEKELIEVFHKIDEVEQFNSMKVLSAFQKNKVTESCFHETTGYGYNDLGRDTIENIYKDIFYAEDALVRSQFISGSHAHDTLDEVIGIKDNPSSLKSFGIKYDQIDLLNNDFDYEKIKDYLKTHKVKVIEIQRSKGYSTRKSISLEKIEKVINLIKSIDNSIIIMIDNCYCEFVTKKEPIEVGADIVVGSLIKNLGGGIAPNGAYIVGRSNLIKLCGERLTLAGEGKEVGPTLGINKQILQGLYFAPSVVASSLKTVSLASSLLEKLGYEVEPTSKEERVDIVETIIFNNQDKLINFVRGIQSSSAIDSNALVEPSPMPGYDDKIIMASGSFTQGSSIELSCDGPLREPYVAYLQGSLTYSYGKLGIMKAISKII